MITGPQIREARRLLGWPVYRMEHRCKIGSVTLAKAERSEGRPDLKEVTLAKIKAALEAAGVEFTDGGQPGVRMRQG